LLLGKPCQKEKTPFTAMTPTTAHPRVAMPCPGASLSARNAKPAAIHRINAKKCVNWPAKRTSSGVPAIASTWLGPYSARRRSASRLESPVRELPRLPSAACALSRLMYK
jgi:hypothetical protein